MTVPTHLISSTPTLLSLHFHHSNDSLYVCTCVFLGSLAYVYFHLPV